MPDLLVPAALVLFGIPFSAGANPAFVLLRADSRKYRSSQRCEVSNAGARYAEPLMGLPVIARLVSDAGETGVAAPFAALLLKKVPC